MKKNQSVYKIYVLIDPRNGQPFYIGATVCSLQKRLSAHISTNPKTKYLGNSLKKYNRLRNIKTAGRDPIIKLLKECSLGSVNYYESFYYRKYIRMGHTLFQHKNQFNYISVTAKSRVPGYSQQVSRNYKERRRLYESKM
jgi:hypothetical protein